MNEKIEDMPSIIAETPYIYLSVTYLDGDTDFLRIFEGLQHQGVLRKVTIYSHTSEANHETVWFRIYANRAVILPAFWWQNNRAWLPIPTIGKFLEFDLNYPVLSGDSFGVGINVAPANGVTFVFQAEPLATIDPKRLKGITKSYQKDLVEIST